MTKFANGNLHGGFQLVQMNPRRRFLTARNLEQLGLLDSIHAHASVLPLPDRCRAPFYDLIDLAWSTNTFRRLYSLPSVEYIAIHETAPLLALRRLILGATFDVLRQVMFDFCNQVAAEIDKDKPVYAYSGAALEVFQATKQAKILDQTALMPLDRWELLATKRGTPPSDSEIAYCEFLQARNAEEIRLADAVVCLYEQTAESVKKWGRNTNVFVIPHPCDEPKPKSAPPLRKLRFLFAGRLSVEKGIQLIEQWILTSALSGAVDFLICGPEEDYPVATLEKRANVSILGQLPQQRLLSLYEDVDLLVFPDCQNAIGNSAFEAMERGTPVLARSNAIIRDEVNGFVFYDDDHFLAKMDELAMRSQRSFFEVGKNALVVAESRYRNYSENLSAMVANVFAGRAISNSVK